MTETKTHSIWCFAIVVVGLAVGSAEARATQGLMISTRSGSVCFNVEIADTFVSRARGLMYRDMLDDRHGMLFRYDGETPVAFWMKNVSFPLDIIFISNAGRIVKIHEKATPDDTMPIKSDVPVTDVLEINGGASKRDQITPGDTVDLPLLAKQEGVLCNQIKSAQ